MISLIFWTLLLLRLITYLNWLNFMYLFKITKCNSVDPSIFYSEKPTIPQMASMLELHNYVMYYLVVILLIAIWIIISITYKYKFIYNHKLYIFYPIIPFSLSLYYNYIYYYEYFNLIIDYIIVYYNIILLFYLIKFTYRMLRCIFFWLILNYIIVIISILFICINNIIFMYFCIYTNWCIESIFILSITGIIRYLIINKYIIKQDISYITISFIVFFIVFISWLKFYINISSVLNNIDIYSIINKLKDVVFIFYIFTISIPELINYHIIRYNYFEENANNYMSRYDGMDNRAGSSNENNINASINDPNTIAIRDSKGRVHILPYAPLVIEGTCISIQNGIMRYEGGNVKIFNTNNKSLTFFDGRILKEGILTYPEGSTYNTNTCEFNNSNNIVYNSNTKKIYINKRFFDIESKTWGNNDWNHYIESEEINPVVVTDRKAICNHRGTADTEYQTNKTLKLSQIFDKNNGIDSEVGKRVLSILESKKAQASQHTISKETLDEEDLPWLKSQFLFKEWLSFNKFSCDNLRCYNKNQQGGKLALTQHLLEKLKKPEN